VPTILMLHGWGNDKTDWEATKKAGGGPDQWHWNNVWFVSRGWVAVNTTARGFKESCGQQDQDANCSNGGYTHLSDRKFETRDSQIILGKLVDAGIAAPKKLVSTGGSYGGGQSWLLATSLPWKSPKGVRLRLAAAVAKYPWTDLLDSLAPNGRATPAKQQRPAAHLNPFGVPKESYIDGLYAVGRATGQGRYDPNPQHYGTDLDEQYQRVQQGEPYDPSSDSRLKTMQHSFLTRSPYFANAYFDAHVLGRTSELPRQQTYSFQTECTSKPKALPPVSGQWNSLSSGKAVATGTGTQTTSSADQNHADGTASDPIANSGCLTEDA